MVESSFIIDNFLPKEVQLQQEFDQLIGFFQDPPPEFAERFSNHVIFLRSKTSRDEVLGRRGFNPKNPEPLATYFPRASDFIRIDLSSFVDPETGVSFLKNIPIPEIVTAFSEDKGLIVVPVPRDQESDFFTPNHISDKPHYFGPVATNLKPIPCYLLDPFVQQPENPNHQLDRDKKRQDFKVDDLLKNKNRQTA